MKKTTWMILLFAMVIVFVGPLSGEAHGHGGWYYHGGGWWWAPWAVVGGAAVLAAPYYYSPYYPSTLLTTHLTMLRRRSWRHLRLMGNRERRLRRPQPRTAGYSSIRGRARMNSSNRRINMNATAGPEGRRVLIRRSLPLQPILEGLLNTSMRWLPVWMRGAIR